MKVYENVLTYIPFIYFLSVTLLFGVIYHVFVDLRAYLILTLLIVNLGVYIFYDTERLITNIITRHLWETCVVSTFGILFQAMHDDVFENQLQKDYNNGIAISFIYMLLIAIAEYVSSPKDYHRNLLCIHLLALYVPIYKLWEINYFVYAMMIIIQSFAMFSSINRDELKDKSLYMRPILTSFQYLMVQDYVLFLSIPHIYFVYYKVYKPQVIAMDSLSFDISRSTADVLKRVKTVTFNEDDDEDDEDEAVFSTDV